MVLFIVKVILIAFFFACVCRKYDEKNDFEHDPHDDGTSINNVNTENDNIKFGDKSRFQSSLQFKSPLADQELNEARLKRTKHDLVWKAVSELVMYGIFMFLASFILYGETRLLAGRYQANVKAMFNTSSVR